MKKLLFVLFVVLGLSASAQTKLSDAQSKELVASLTETALSMQTMQCRFVQQKAMSMMADPLVSEGKLCYVSPDRMRWEYVTPYSSALVANGDRIVKVTDGVEETLDGKTARMYQGLVGIIMGSASGKKLFDTSLFDVTLYDDNPFWKAEMNPKRRDMKRMFSQLVFRFSKETLVISAVDFVETGGDVTSIRFEDIRLNEPVEEQF